MSNPTTLNTSTTTSNSQACAACRHHRKKCSPNCVLAPYFPITEYSNFVNAHKLFGSTKIERSLLLIPDQKQRAIAALTMIAEGNAWAADPSMGCSRMIGDLTRKIRTCQAELTLVNNRLLTYKAQENSFIVNGVNNQLDVYRAQETGFVVNGVNNHLENFRPLENVFVSNGNGNENNNGNGYDEVVHGEQRLRDIELELESLLENNTNSNNVSKEGFQLRDEIGMKENVELEQEAHVEEKELNVAASEDFSTLLGDFVNNAEPPRLDI